MADHIGTIRQKADDSVRDITTKLFDELWRRILGFLLPKEIVKCFISIPIIREKTLQKADLLNVAKLEIESHGHEFKAVLGRLGMLTEVDGLVIMNSFHKLRKCFRSGCMQLFSERYNYKDSCLYHPGRQGAGKVLSCCRGQGFKSTPCRRGFHDGRVFDAIMYTPKHVSAGKKDGRNDDSTPTLPPIKSFTEIIYTPASTAVRSAAKNISDGSLDEKNTRRREIALDGQISLPAVTS